MTRLRIALVHPFPWPEVRRGAERYLSDLTWFLSEDGHEVDVVTGTGGPSRVDLVDGVRTRRRHLLGRRRLEHVGVSVIDAFGAVALPTLLRHRYDVVHALVPSGAVAARLAGRRTVYTILGHPTPEQVGVRRLDAPILRTALRVANRVTVLSEASRESTRFLTQRRLDVLPPGLRSEAFPPNLEARSGPLRVLFSADASDERKGAETLLRAFALLLRDHPDARLQHSGVGSVDAALAQLPDAERGLVAAAIDRLGPGRPTDVAERYRAATVTVLPARHEAFGLVLVESLSCGTPVVCAADGGPPEIVDDPRVGTVAAPGEAVALAAAIGRSAALAADPQTPAHCAAHARRWDWTKAVGPRHVELYDEIRRSHPRRAESGTS